MFGRVFGVVTEPGGIKSFMHVKDQYQPRFLESEHDGLNTVRTHPTVDEGVGHVPNAQTSTSLFYTTVQDMIM